MDKQIQNCPPPLVTVAMPVYNAGKYLRLSVLSIVKQTFQNWELLIIDDGSTDNALRDIADIKDVRIQIFRDGLNKGLAARLNEAVNLAQGYYFARMDQDDVSYPERFAWQIAVLDNDPGLNLVAVRAITIDENNQAIGLFPHAISHQEICARPWLGFYLPHPTWMGRTEWFRKHLYAIPGPYFCEDQELLLRSYRNSQFGTVDQILFAYRIRRKRDWGKHAKTRRSVFIAQIQHFSSVFAWHFVLLATVAFVGKISSDLSKRMLPETWLIRRKVIGTNAVFEWRKVLDSTTASLA